METIYLQLHFDFEKLHLQFEMDYGYLTSIREKSLTFRKKKKEF